MMTSANKIGNGADSQPSKPIINSSNGYQNNVRTPRGSTLTLGASSSAGGGWKADTGSITTGRSSLSKIKILAGSCVDDPRTSKGRRMQLIKILGMAAVPIVILVIQSALAMSTAIMQQTYAASFKAQVRFAVQAGDVVQALGLERGTTTFYVSMENVLLLPAALGRQRMVNNALIALDSASWPDIPEQNFYQSKEQLQLNIALNRYTINSTTPQRQLEFFTDIIAHFLRFIGDAVIKSKAAEQKWQELAAYHLFISGKEGFAAERSSGTITFGRGNMTMDDYRWHYNQRCQGDAFLNRSIQYNPAIGQEIATRYTGSLLNGNITMYRAIIDANNLGYKALEMGRDYYAKMSAYQDVLHDIEKILTDNITANLNTAISHANQSVGAQLFILVLAVVLFPSIIALLRHITGQIQSFASILQTKNEEVVKEKKRAEAVLNQLLPRQIAEKVKNREQIYPESYDQVTIFFSDIVEFTNFSSVSTPLQIVDTLNKLYTAMDKRIENYDVYKVETIGDAYLCASGLPERNGNRHSYEIASMSLELITDVSLIRIPHKPDYALRMRIGLHTGPCAAGIIGNKMPRYCIFGDTVNTASRMESHGEPLRIHISTATHDALRYFSVFEMECRGEIIIKGKGPMTTWWLMKKLKEDKKQMFGPEV